MSSVSYTEICEKIYVQIMRKLERGHEEGGRFAPIGTTQQVLRPKILRRFFRSLEFVADETTDEVDLNEENLINRMSERDLYDFLAILIFTSCTVDAARTFTIKLLAQNSWPKYLCTLPAERGGLIDLFEEEITPDKFLSQQACFHPVVIKNKEEVQIQSLDRQCLPYLEEKLRGKGSFGTVYEVKIATGHFHDAEFGANKEPMVIARKDYQFIKNHRPKDEHEIMKQILASDRTCPNIVKIYGSLAIGLTKYSVFMPLAKYDLRAYMIEEFPTRPSTNMEKTALILSASGLAGGLMFLHHELRTAKGDEMVCYHMDLKPSNILIFHDEIGDKPQFIWKISDFGMSRVKFRSHGQKGTREKDFGSWFVRFQKPRDASAPSGTLNMRGEGTYLGPESLAPTRDMGTANDVWSLGCVISILFAYLEEGRSGVTRYQEQRIEYRNAEGYDRFFIPNARFGHPKLHPVVSLWHRRLIKKARERNSMEGDAVESMLDYLEREVLLPRQEKRCNVKELKRELDETHQKYRRLKDISNEHTSEDQSGVGRALRSMRLDRLMDDTQGPASDGRVDRWFLRAHEAFKGCEISPDGSVVAFWTDTKISLFTSQSLGPADSGRLVLPVAEYEAEPGRLWKSISLTRKHLIASISGGDIQCYIFHLRRGSLPDVNLHHRDLIARELPDIRKVAISPRSQQIACIVRDKDDDKNPASLYFGSVGSPNRWQLGMILDWPAADVVQLSFSTDNDLHIVFRPQFAARSRKFEIPVLYVCLQSKQLYSLIIEPQGIEGSSTVGLFTTFAPFGQKPHVGALVTREKQLHIQSLVKDDNTPAIQADIKNYRVHKLMMGENDERMFAVGKRVANHKMLLLELTMPRPGEGAKHVSVKEVAEIPGLAYNDEFTERIFYGQESYLLLAAIRSGNRCGIYKIGLPGSSSGFTTAT